MSHVRQYALLLIVLMALNAVLFAVSLVVGPTQIEWSIGLKALFSGEPELLAIVMREIRLPRAILALAVGGILGLSGAVLQGLLRNPLAEPGVIGVGASASFGAVIAFYTGLSAQFALALPLAAIVAAFVGASVILIIASRTSDMLTLILSGVALATLMGALTTLALNLSPNPFASLEIVFWMMGSLTDRSMMHVWLAVPFIAVGAVLLFSTGRSLNALTLGEDVAQTLGIRLKAVRSLAILGTACGVGAATAVSGAIGFVGLIVPHLIRPIVSHRPSALLLPSALGGSALILAADTLVRVILPGRDLKLGVVTALIGVPFFFLLIAKARRHAP